MEIRLRVLATLSPAHNVGDSGMDSLVVELGLGLGEGAFCGESGAFCRLNGAFTRVALRSPIILRAELREEFRALLSKHEVLGATTFLVKVPTCAGGLRTLRLKVIVMIVRG